MERNRVRLILIPLIIIAFILPFISTRTIFETNSSNLMYNERPNLIPLGNLILPNSYILEASVEGEGYIFVHGSIQLINYESGLSFHHSFTLSEPGEKSVSQVWLIPFNTYRVITQIHLTGNGVVTLRVKAFGFIPGEINIFIYLAIGLIGIISLHKYRANSSNREEKTHRKKSIKAPKEKSIKAPKEKIPKVKAAIKPVDILPEEEIEAKRVEPDTIKKCPRCGEMSDRKSFTCVNCGMKFK